MSDDGPTSVGALDFIRHSNTLPHVTGYRLIGNFDLWKKRIREFSVDSDAICIYMYHTVRKAGEELSMDPPSVMAWTTENTTVRTVGFFDFAIKDGALCGVVESGQEHGFEAAQMALKLLSGTDINDLSVSTAEEGISLAFLSVLLFSLSSIGFAENETYHVGVLATRGQESCLKAWRHTADYLTDAIPGAVFEIIPLDHSQFRNPDELYHLEFLSKGCRCGSG